jgi:hypothetical protein
VVKGGFFLHRTHPGRFYDLSRCVPAAVGGAPAEVPVMCTRFTPGDHCPGGTPAGPPRRFQEGVSGLRLNNSASRPKTGRRFPTNRKGRLPLGGRPAPVSGEAGLGSVGPGRHGAVASADRAPPPASCFQTCPVPRKGDRAPRPPPSPVDGSVRPERSGACIDTRCAALLQLEPPQPRHPASLSRRPPSGGRRTQRGRVPATQAVRRKPRG